MQYSLHLQFSNPKQGKNFKEMELKKEKGHLSLYNKEKNICEKCNYVHLVHCPMNDLICDTKVKKARCLKKINLRSQHHHNKDIVCDRKRLDKNDEIKIEG